jgi:predicted MFS family arabinose efflux permease
LKTELSPKRELWLLLTLAGIQFTHILDFMIMMPLGPEFTRVFGISDAQFGALVSTYTLAAGVSGLLAATFLDAFDRKKMLLVLYSLFGLATLACGLASSFDTLMLARILAGTFGGVLSALAQTIVADVIPFARRGRAMGIVMTSFSVSTVAGVPLGLWLAAHFSWHMPFFGISVIVGVLVMGAWVTLPKMSDHLQGNGRRGGLQPVFAVLADAQHRLALLFSALMMFAGFTVIPFITLYLRSNVGWPAERVPLVYLCGGVVTLLTARLIGGATDRLGKVRVYRWMALVVTLPLMATTLMQGLPVWAVLSVSTLFFVCMSGRMIPGMAILSSAANPQLRGTFMALNSSIQSAAMGVAAFVGGQIISRDAQNLVQHYWVAALVGCIASVLSIALVGRIKMYGSLA